MSEAKHTPVKLELSVEAINQRQFEISSNWLKEKGEWEEIYVSFSGFFGSYNPHIFAAAPDLVEAVKHALETSDREHDRRIYRAALAKAGSA